MPVADSVGGAGALSAVTAMTSIAEEEAAREEADCNSWGGCGSS
jgi:hypothetical protein